jgi:beta-phosphoglucomutase
VELRAFSAVLFDLDGVLIDSMRFHVQAWLEVFKSCGVILDPREILLREGEKAGTTALLLAQKYGLNWTQSDLDAKVRAKREIYQRQAPRNMRPIARQLVEFCRGTGLKTAIVTGSVRANLQAVLSDQELKLFNVIVTAEEVKQGKPDPEPYLRAADLLQIPSHSCLVIENAPLGIRSAKAAGMTCVAIETTLSREDLEEADRVISDLDQLEELTDLHPKL